MALKVLPEAFTADPDRLARFEREARVLASLNAGRFAGGPIPLDGAAVVVVHDLARGASNPLTFDGWSRRHLRQWDGAPDGQRFLMIQEEEGAAGDDPREGLSELVYVGNWFTELVERVPLP